MKSSEDVTNRNREYFNTKLRWNVYNENFNNIRSFSYSFFRFKFDISDIEIQKEFAELITSKNNIDVVEICNFFYNRNIKFSLHFRYLKEFGFKINRKAFKYFYSIKKEIFKANMKSFLPSYKVKPVARKRKDNNKNIYELSLTIFNVKKKRSFIILLDNNIWWKPKVMKKTFDNGIAESFGCYFSSLENIE